MSEWKEVYENDQLFYINDELGNIVKAGDEAFIAVVPRMVKLGPFKTPEEAKSAVEGNQESLNKYLENFNNQLIGFSDTVRTNG